MCKPHKKTHQYLYTVISYLTLLKREAFTFIFLQLARSYLISFEGDIHEKGHFPQNNITKDLEED